MNIYDQINDLAMALKVSPEVVEYKAALEKINSDSAKKKMVDDFRKKQFELYSLQLQGIEPSKEKVEELNNLFNVIALNSDVRQFLEAEMKFSRLWEDIIGTLGEAAGIQGPNDMLNNK